MRSNLPLEVLSLVGPILSWVEGMEGLRVPEHWLHSRVPPEERERAWLIRELPTYSYDNVDEIVRLSRSGGSATTPRSLRITGLSMGEPHLLNPPRDYELGAVFEQLAERYFRWRGPELCVQEGRMEELHELALRFPLVHLIRHAHARAVRQGFISETHALKLPEQVSLLHTYAHGMRAVVNRGIAEGHVHLWGVPSASDTWADELLRHLTPGVLEEHRRHERRLVVLSRAAVRLLGHAVLRSLSNTRDGSSLPFYVLALLDQAYLARNRMEERLALQRIWETLRHMQIALADSPSSHDGEHDHAWALRLADPVQHRLWQWRRRLRGRLLAPEGMRDRIRTLEQLHLLAHGSLIQPAPHDALQEFLHQVFFRYVIFQTHHWHLATQSGRTTGLRQFQRFFRSKQRRPLLAVGSDYVEVQGLVMEHFRSTASIRRVEGRLGPPSTGPDELVPWLLGYAEGVKRNELDGFGFVIHFKKASRGEAEAKTRRVARQVVRYGRIRRTTREQALRLYRVLSRPHPAVPFIVGIDAASLELTTPPEVFAPAFRFLREFPIDPADRVPPWERFGVEAEITSLLASRHLGLTYHVGEDFRHLLSGLRAIDEAIEFLKPRPGDRLGHAIALALDPGVWAAQTGFQAVLSKQEWLDNLVWAHHVVGPGHDVSGELGLEDRIQRLSREVYGASDLTGERRFEWDWSPLALHDAWLMRQLDPYSFNILDLTRGDYRLRRRARFHNAQQRWEYLQSRVLEEVKSEVGSNVAFYLLGLYWYHPEVRERGNQVITVDMQADPAERELWLRLLRDVQRRMRERVQRHQLVIEVNPSANRIIGPLSALSEHPVFQMTLDEDHRLARKIRVTVNTDDPGVFSTSLPHEYYLLGEILLSRGVPEADVENWLEWLRTNGHETSFVRSLPDGHDPRIRKILKALMKRNRQMSEHLGGSKAHRHFWHRVRRRERKYAQRPDSGAR